MSVPPRVAPTWLTDESGAVHAHLAAGYVMKAGRSRDGAAHQIATMGRSRDAGYTAALSVGA